MRWKGRRQSTHVEDRRTTSAGRIRLPAGQIQTLLRIVPWLIRILGFKGTLLVAVGLGLWFYLSGGKLPLPGMAPSSTPPASTSAGTDDAEKQRVAFVRTVLADTEDTWQAVLKKEGKAYPPPTVVLYRGVVNSACGTGSSAMGPFYCPGDQRIYLDLGFFDELADRFGAPGDFAQAYVIAHEVGHHVQNLLGTSSRVHRAQQRLNKTAANKLSVRLELQADCYAGIWAHYADHFHQLLEEGDIEEGLKAAQAVGDDRLQKMATGHVSPDAFTHGTSEQRMRWFMQGYRQGQLAQCDTFSASNL